MKTFALLLSISSIAATTLAADTATRPPWLAGPQLEAQLKAPVKLAWSGVPLRRAIDDLAKLNRVALLLDRRIDPSQPIDLTTAGRPLADVLDDIADRAGIGFTRVAGLGYFGPTSTTDRLRTIATLRHDEAARLPNAAPAPWLRTGTLAWDDLTTARELIEKLAGDAKIEIRGLDKLPHDLWAGARLPSMSMVDRLTILTAEFDLTFRFEKEGRAAELVAWPEDPVIERTYSVTSRPSNQVEQWRALAPSAVFQITGSKITVRARQEDHDLIAAARQSPSGTKFKPKSNAPRVEVYTLKLDEVPLEKLLPVLEQKLKIQFEIDREAIGRAGIRLDRNVSFHVEQATLDRLLEAALEPAGLTFIRDGQRVRVFAAATK